MQTNLKFIRFRSSQDYLPAELSVVRQTPFMPKIIRDYTMRALTLEELANTVYTWFPLVYTPNSQKATFSSDPNGWFALDEGGTPIGALASLHKANATSWYSYFYIAEALRGTGLGKELFNNVMQIDAAKGVNKISFQCFANLEPLYNKFGFQTIYQDSINRGQFDAPYQPALSADIQCTCLSNHAFGDIMQYDRIVQRKHDRQVFLRQWLLKPKTESVIAFDQRGQVAGYSVISPFYFKSNFEVEHHQRVAPLYANTPEIAEQLLTTSIAVATTMTSESKSGENCKSVFLDTDGGNPAAAEVLRRFGMFKQVAPLSRMVRIASNQSEPENFYDASKVFGFTDYANGP